MSRLDELYQLSIKLDKTLEKVTNDNREKMIEKINDLIDKRENIMKQITPPYSTDEIKVGQKVVNLNKRIEKRIGTAFAELRQEMRQVQQQKKSNRSYINPYGPIKSIDGMYVDSKQ